MAGAPWASVRQEHLDNVGFVEGRGNQNPWTEEIGAGDAAYCVSEATIVPHHHGVQWQDGAGHVQFPPKGFAYCPYLVTWGVANGYFEFDHTSKGAPAVAYEGDIYLWDWNYDGVADHATTAMADDRGGDGHAHNVLSANSGSPEGVHYPVDYNRKYLLGVLHMSAWAYNENEPVFENPPVVIPAVPHGTAVNPYGPLVVDGQRGSQTNKALQWALNQKLFWGGEPGRALIEDGQFGDKSKKVLQWYLGVDQDGDVGRETVKALQRLIGAKVDGDWGPATTKALQNALNNYTF